MMTVKTRHALAGRSASCLQRTPTLKTREWRSFLGGGVNQSGGVLVRGGGFALFLLRTPNRLHVSATPMEGGQGGGVGEGWKIRFMFAGNPYFLQGGGIEGRGGCMTALISPLSRQKSAM
jgi:hypothetical protein